jgi:hypothetical protein
VPITQFLRLDQFRAPPGVIGISLRRHPLVRGFDQLPQLGCGSPGGDPIRYIAFLGKVGEI